MKHLVKKTPPTRTGRILLELVKREGDRRAVFDTLGMNESYFARLLNHASPPGRRILADICRAFPGAAESLFDAWLRDRADRDKAEIQELRRDLARGARVRPRA